ncbi:PD-(D/E)XK nuclease family protein [Gracilinema caldarium]|uniref:PD-(D/E)XK endonuclease-like domain-containing protein n=1 Tax=Gracilinema caldarium (strain ATCC 51460 / DSM 7334 / H1) TaxID=744872 RepID=F8EY77_GRAC1|nr:PD-(D/E)XK nuclease family protein [Gracilinema caldarium]AEJ18236.1 hypothetical protein Spica_0064 [Gracilinema caldarium DSM 7334]
MGKSSLQELLYSYLDNRNAVFVFPSAVPAQFWARRLCETTQKPVALERFIAWDEFKEQCLSAHQSEKRPANSLIRMLFTSHLLEENAKEATSGTPLFAELLPPSYASDYTPFIGHISSMLPSLKIIIERTSEITFKTDTYIRDLRILFHRYSDFLASHNLYEPDWIRSPFQDHGRHWILILPDLTDDWESYENELSSQQSVFIFMVKDIQIDEHLHAVNRVSICGSTLEKSPEESYERTSNLLIKIKQSLLQFPSWREEIRYVANLLAQLVHSKTLSIEEIVLSIPNLENYAEELSLECKLRGIPISIRQGKALTDQSGGRLFPLLQDCYQTHWSYRAMKNLLTDQSLPWKEPQLIQQLLNFGLEYRCLSGYKNNNRITDVWLETFKHILEANIGTPFSIIDLKQFYQQLQRDISDVVNAHNFTELRTKLILFAGNHFDRERINPDTDKVYARAMEELARLIETEEHLADCSTGKAFPLFLAHLKTTTYVYQSDIEGIAVYPYRVAAGIAPTLHIVMNVTQDGASVIVDPAPFLREDRKKSLECVSRDRSKAFIDAYSLSSIIVYTAPDRGVTGHTIPHQALTSENQIQCKGETEAPLLKDSYRLEELGTGLEASAPYTIQQLAWKRSQQSYRPYVLSQDIRKAPIDEAVLRDTMYTRLTTKRDPNHISPTDINQFITCPHQWLLTRGLAIREPQLEIETIGQKEIGILYHAILEAFFNHLQETPGRRIRASEIENYNRILKTIIKDKIADQQNEEGAFQESVYEMLFQRIKENLIIYLTNEIPTLDSCSVLGSEYHLRRHYPELDIYLAGTADLILMDTEGQLIIIDFKTNNAPKKRELWLDSSGMVSNFQIAAYIKMAEQQLKTTVSRAAFYSIEQRMNVKVIDPEGPSKKNTILPVKRTDYEPVLTKLDETLALMVDYLKIGNYPVVHPANRGICTSCPVKAVCRINFSGGDKA